MDSFKNNIVQNNSQAMVCPARALWKWLKKGNFKLNCEKVIVLLNFWTELIIFDVPYPPSPLPNFSNHSNIQYGKLVYKKFIY